MAGPGNVAAPPPPPRRSLPYKLQSCAVAACTLSFFLLASAAGLYLFFIPFVLILLPLSPPLFYAAGRALLGARPLLLCRLGLVAAAAASSPPPPPPGSWATLCVALLERAPPRVAGGRCALVLCNHKCDLDYFFLWALLAKPGCGGPLGPGAFNAVAKAPLRTVPLFGWLFKCVGFLFLSRSWGRDRARVGAWCARLAASSPSRPMWLLLYPEGTRYTARARAASDAAGLAAAGGGGGGGGGPGGGAPFPPPGVELLRPRHRGLGALAAALPRARFTHLVDLTLCYVSESESGGEEASRAVGWARLGSAALLAAAAGRLPFRTVELHVDVVPFGDVPPWHGEGGGGEGAAAAAAAADPPGQEARLRAWLDDRWRRKAEMLAACASTGRLVPGAPYDDAPVPAARVATSALAFALSGALLVRLALTSPPFRAYLLLSSAAAAAVARADPLWW